MAQSKLATFLEQFFDNHDFGQPREHWAVMLDVKPNDIEDWIQDVDMPQPRQMRTIITLLFQHHGNEKLKETARELLESLISDVVGENAHSRMIIRLSCLSFYLLARNGQARLKHYVLLPRIEGFFRTFNTLSYDAMEQAMRGTSDDLAEAMGKST